MSRLALAAALSFSLSACAAAAPPPPRYPSTFAQERRATSDPAEVVGVAARAAATQLVEHAISSSSRTAGPEPSATRAAPAEHGRYRCHLASGEDDEIVADSSARASSVCAELAGESCTCEEIAL